MRASNVTPRDSNSSSDRAADAMVHGNGLNSSAGSWAIPASARASRCPARPPGSALDEVTRDVARRGPAVDEDPIGELLLDLSDEDDRREVVGVLDDAVLETDRVEDEAVDEVRAGPRHELLLAPRLRGGLLDLHGETPLVRDVHDVVEEVGGERRGEVGERHGDRARTAVAEPAGAEIGDEVELGHRRLDALHGLGAHEHGAGDDVRDGLRRHPGEGGHVLHRRPRRSCHVLRIGEAVTG
jgi:hypothetical protein